MRQPATEVIGLELRGRARRRLSYLLAGVVAASALAGMYIWHRLSGPEPPQVDCSRWDQAIAKAIERKRAQVVENPRSAPAWGYYGMVLFGHEFNEEALACFAQAERLDPEDARWPYIRGVIYARGNPEAAITQYRRAAELERDDWGPVRLRLADLLLIQGHTEEAEAQYNRLLDANPNHVRAHLGLARVALEKSEFQECREHLNQCLNDSYTQKSAHMVQALLSARHDDLTGSVHEERRVASLPKDLDWPDSTLNYVYSLRMGATALGEQAHRMIVSGLAADAVVLLREGVQKYPDKAFLYQCLGEALHRTKQYEEAEQELQTAVRLHPDVGSAHFSLGLTRYSQKKYAAAAEAFREVTRLLPDHEAAHYYLGECLREQGDDQGAIQSFEAAISRHPRHAASHKSLGQLLARTGKKKEALDHLRLAVQLDPEDAEAKTLLQSAAKDIGSAGTR